MTDTREFTDAHGVAIVYDVHPAAGTPRGVVQLLHGVGEHAGRYGALIGALTEAGFHVYADDHRGHGRTGIRQHGGPEKLGRLGVGGLRAAEDAVWQLTGIIRDENPDLPLVLLGHSWGSFLAQMLVNHHPEAWDAVILSGSALRTPRVPQRGTPERAVGEGRRRHRARMAQPRSRRVGRVRRRSAHDRRPAAQALRSDRGPARLYGRPAKDLGRDIPMLLLVGRDDPVGGPRSVHKLADEYRSRSGLTDITTLVYPDARHEIFAELQQEEVRADVLALARRTHPPRAEQRASHSRFRAV